MSTEQPKSEVKCDGVAPKSEVKCDGVAPKSEVKCDGVAPCNEVKCDGVAPCNEVEAPKEEAPCNEVEAPKFDPAEFAQITLHYTAVDVNGEKVDNKLTLPRKLTEVAKAIISLDASKTFENSDTIKLTAKYVNDADEIMEEVVTEGTVTAVLDNVFTNTLPPLDARQFLMDMATRLFTQSPMKAFAYSAVFEAPDGSTSGVVCGDILVDPYTPPTKPICKTLLNALEALRDSAKREFKIEEDTDIILPGTPAYTALKDKLGK